MERLKQSNIKNNNDDDDSPPPSTPSFTPPPPYYLPSQSIDEDDSDIENHLNATQKCFLGDKSKQEKIAIATGEKSAAAVKKVRFSENLNKLFPKASEIFNGIVVDDDGLLNHEITIANTQTTFKELNDGNLPGELKFFSR